MKTLLIVGCYGTIGLALIENLIKKYKIIGCDIIEKKKHSNKTLHM